MHLSFHLLLLGIVKMILQCLCLMMEYLNIMQYLKFICQGKDGNTYEFIQSFPSSASYSLELDTISAFERLNNITIVQWSTKVLPSINHPTISRG